MWDTAELGKVGQWLESKELEAFHWSLGLRKRAGSPGRVLQMEEPRAQQGGWEVRRERGGWEERPTGVHQGPGNHAGSLHFILSVSRRSFGGASVREVTGDWGGTCPRQRWGRRETRSWGTEGRSSCPRSRCPCVNLGDSEKVAWSTYLLCAPQVEPLGLTADLEV